jgi:hypothetical protein
VSRTLVVGLVSMSVAVLALSACSTHLDRAYIPFCPEVSEGGSALILMAQSVPTATFIPCIAAFPAGWSFGGEDIRSGRSEFWLDSDRAGSQAVTVSLTMTCDVAGAVPVPAAPSEVGLRRYERPTSLPPQYAGSRYYLFPGGCVTYRFAFAAGSSFGPALEVTDALRFIARSEGVRALAAVGIRLCGAGVSCPG